MRISISSTALADRIEMVSKRYGREIRNQGLGFRLEGSGRSSRFSHRGGNEGYRCFLVAYTGSELVQEIVRSIAKEYGWVDYLFGLPA